MEEFYVDSAGNFLGTFIGSVPAGGIRVPNAPADARQKWINSAWTAAPVILEPVGAISARQLRLTLVRNGYSLQAVEAAVNGLPLGSARTEAQIEWEYATTFDRANPTLLAIALVLGISETKLDTMWAAALIA